MEHLYEKLEGYAQSDYYPYHMPGHKRRLNGCLPEVWVKTDITEIDGFDNLHQPEGILKQLQQEAAALYGAKESYYLVNGSTAGILTAVSAALPQGGHLLMARNCHRSAYHGAYLRNLTISYLYPSIMKEYDICEAITSEQVKEALEQNKGIGAVLIVSPTYEGRIADVEAIANTVHEYGIPLIVDEAHGAHLGMYEGLATNSCRLGADFVINSVHKTLPAPTQTALLHINGTLADSGRVKRFLDIYQSSSPSYPLMAGIDNALMLVQQKGQQLFREFLQNWEWMLGKLSGCKRLFFLSGDAKVQDIGKLVINLQKTGLSGQQLYDMLLQEYHLQLEMAAGSYCLAMFTIGDTPEGFHRMAEALLEIDNRLCESQVGNSSEESTQYVLDKIQRVTGLQQKVLLHQAWDMPVRELPLEQCTGKTAADFINLYPPGTPIVVPGEVLTGEILDIISYYKRLGLNVQGVASSAAGFVLNVLAEE